MLDNEKLPPKVVLMFDAVNEIVHEHKELSEITVSDITTRAGIGKGTAYEYFKSKEEIVVRAIMYAMKKGLTIVKALISEEKGFEQSVLDVMKWIRDNQREAKSYMQFLRMPHADSKMMDFYKMELHERHKDCAAIRDEVTMHFLDLALKEKLIVKTDNLDYIEVIISTGFFGYIMYLDNVKDEENPDSDMVYQKFCEHIMQGIANR